MIQVKIAKPDCFILSGQHKAPAIGSDNNVILKDRHEVKLDSWILVLGLFPPSCETSDKPIHLFAPQFPRLSKWTLHLCSAPKRGLGPWSTSTPWGVLEMQNLSPPAPRLLNPNLYFSLPQKCEQHEVASPARQGSIAPHVRQQIPTFSHWY